MDMNLAIRLSAFLGIFAVMASLELLAPRRRLDFPKSSRWMANLSLAVMNTLLIRVLFSAGAVGMAVVAADRGWGLLNVLQWPAWVEVLITLVVLDLVIYLQHVAFHVVPGIWRFHFVHHADPDYDVTTGVRFHPVEAVVSMLVKMTAVMALGAAAVAVVAFEVILNAVAMFNHSNVRLPLPLDRLLRWVIVTPDMHRVHHSTVPQERKRNFGFNLPWWDYLFGTYRAEPALGQEGMSFGVEGFRDQGCIKLGTALTLPFKALKGRWSGAH